MASTKAHGKLLSLWNNNDNTHIFTALFEERIYEVKEYKRINE